MHPKFPLTRNRLHHYDLSIMQRKNFGVVSWGGSEYVKVFQVQIIRSSQLPKPRPGQLGLSKSGELFLSIFLLYVLPHLG